MENFKKNIKIRISGIILFDILAFTLLLFTSLKSSKLGSFSSLSDMERGMVTGFQIGLFLGLQVIILYLLVKYIKAIKKDIYLKSLYIKENDERKKLIKSNTFSCSYITTLTLLLLATIITGYFNGVIFKALISVLYGALLITCMFKIYFSKKY